MIEIIICEKCKGTGTVEVRELIDYHHGTYNITDKECSLCKGSGRMKKTTTVTIEPYQP
jgi:DnaJ-class molecular chaperone